MLARYPSAPWQERTGLALLTVVRLHAGLAIHSYGAYNAGLCAAAIVLVHFVSERVAGSIRGSGLLVAEGVAFVTFVWMMVQRGKYVGKSFAFSCVLSALSIWAEKIG